jgi:hypothetical protein
LHLSEETDLDLLNLAMDKMVEYFQEELIPVAAQLTERLVNHLVSCDAYLLTLEQCAAYQRLVREAIAAEEGPGRSLDVDDLVDGADDDKTYAAMGVAKTIATVKLVFPYWYSRQLSWRQVVSSVDSSTEILLQVQEYIIPIVTFTLENKMLGACHERMRL